jgi:hypothetical protein
MMKIPSGYKAKPIGAVPDAGDGRKSWRTATSAQGAFGRGIDVGRRDEVRAQEVGDFFGVDAVVLIFAAVDEVQIGV